MDMAGNSYRCLPCFFLFFYSKLHLFCTLLTPIFCHETPIVAFFFVQFSCSHQNKLAILKLALWLKTVTLNYRSIMWRSSLILFDASHTLDLSLSFVIFSSTTFILSAFLSVCRHKIQIFRYFIPPPYTCTV